MAKKKASTAIVPAVATNGSGFMPDGSLGTKASRESKVSFVQKVIKNDTYLVMAASQVLPEDEFAGLYFTDTDPNSPTKRFIEPPFNLKHLKQLTRQNNTLRQCVEAMQLNIHGT